MTNLIAEMNAAAENFKEKMNAVRSAITIPGEFQDILDELVDADREMANNFKRWPRKENENVYETDPEFRAHWSESFRRKEKAVYDLIRLVQLKNGF